MRDKSGRLMKGYRSSVIKKIYRGEPYFTLQS